MRYKVEVYEFSGVKPLYSTFTDEDDKEECIKAAEILFTRSKEFKERSKQYPPIKYPLSFKATHNIECPCCFASVPIIKSTHFQKPFHHEYRYKYYTGYQCTCGHLIAKEQIPNYEYKSNKNKKQIRSTVISEYE